MQADQWKKVEELFQAAITLPPEKRSAFLERACSGDPGLRTEVESLLNHDLSAGSFLDSSPFPPGVSIPRRWLAARNSGIS